MRSFAPNHEAYWFETYGKVALTGQPVRFTNEAKALNRWYDVFAFPVGEGKVHNVAILFNDITQRKNLERQLKDSERLAAIGATAGMVGHDIRNPLQAIIGDVYLAKGDVDSLKKSEEKESLQESLTAIEKNTEYINKIVADLQDFARPLHPHVEETNLNHIVKELLSKNGLPDNVKPQVKIAKRTQPLTTDSAYMKRMLGNLINNAVQAMPNGGTLTINATTKNDKRNNNSPRHGHRHPRRCETQTLHATVHHKIQRTRLRFSSRQTHDRSTQRHCNPRKPTRQRHHLHYHATSKTLNPEHTKATFRSHMRTIEKIAQKPPTIRKILTESDSSLFLDDKFYIHQPLAINSNVQETHPCTHKQKQGVEK
jgi:hypothetical protein